MIAISVFVSSRKAPKLVGDQGFGCERTCDDAVPGSHILSGNVFDPRALNELIPDWKEKGVRA